MHTGNPDLGRNRALYAAVCTVHRNQFSDFSRDVYLSEKGYLERIQEEIKNVTKSRLRERKIPMLECDYEVKQIDGDYAHLNRPPGGGTEAGREGTSSDGNLRGLYLTL